MLKLFSLAEVRDGGAGHVVRTPPGWQVKMDKLTLGSPHELKHKQHETTAKTKM